MQKLLALDSIAETYFSSRTAALNESHCQIF